MSRKASRASSGSSGTSASAPVAKLSLRETVQQNILSNVFKASEKYVLENGQQFGTQGWMVAVVDPESLRVISSSVGMYNLMENHVSIVEDLMKKRAPFRNQAVLYFVEPTRESIEKIVEDWTPTRDKKGPLYGNIVFLYFLGPLSDEMFAIIKSCKELVKRVKILKEVNLDFLTKEADAFHFDMKDNSMFKKLYLSDPSSPNKLVKRIVSKLVTVCATLNEYPHVRFPADNTLCKTVAFTFQEKMNEFVGSNDTWWYHGDAFHQTSERSTLILLDRKDDCLSPLIHEFTYEAMVNDLLPIDDDRITYDSVNAGTSKEGESEEGTTKMDALLNDNDEVWVELRGKHIADVIQTLSTKIRDIVNSSTGSALKSSGKSSGKALSINQMAKALKALPEYREIMSKLSQHMQIAHQCMDAFNAQGLLDLSELEQTFATGETDEGRNPKLNELLGQVVEHFRSQNDSIMRLRLLAIAIVSQRGLSTQNDLEKLLGEANLNNKETKAVQNLEKMGCPLVANADGGKVMSKIAGRRATPYGAGASESESEYSSSRYVCLMKAILQEATSGTLSVEDYPSVMPLPDPESAMASSAAKSKVTSVRKAGAASSKWAKQSGGSEKGGRKKNHGGRQIVFMVGGMCYSELRTAREIMASSGTDIIVGSTRFIKPSDFMADILRLG